VISQKPIDSVEKGGTPDVYLAVSGGAGLGTEIRASGGGGLPGLEAALAGSNPAAHIIHWRDRRVQPINSFAVSQPPARPTGGFWPFPSHPPPPSPSLKSKQVAFQSFLILGFVRKCVILA
jgi:hypothetical protein